MFSYRFDTPLWNAPFADDAKHFVIAQLDMQNISVLLQMYESYCTVSCIIGRAYISFVCHHDLIQVEAITHFFIGHGTHRKSHKILS